MSEIDKRSSYRFHLVDELFRKLERGFHIKVEVVAHGAVHEGERMHAQVGNHIILQVVKAESVGNARAKSGLRSEAHRVVVTNIQLDKFLVTTRQVHP